MTDKETFKAYCDYYNLDFDLWESFMPYLGTSFSYRRFELKIAIKELKQSIKDVITDIRLRVKGIVK